MRYINWPKGEDPSVLFIDKYYDYPAEDAEFHGLYGY